MLNAVIVVEFQRASLIVYRLQITLCTRSVCITTYTLFNPKPKNTNVHNKFIVSEMSSRKTAPSLIRSMEYISFVVGNGTTRFLRASRPEREQQYKVNDTATSVCRLFYCLVPFRVNIFTQNIACDTARRRLERALPY